MEKFVGVRSKPKFGFPVTAVTVCGVATYLNIGINKKTKIEKFLILLIFN